MGKEHARHLLGVVKQYYKVIDHLGAEKYGSKFSGIGLEWNYDKRRVHLSMPGYVPEALVQFKKERPSNLQDQPHKNIHPKSGQAQQFVEDAPETVSATAEENTFIQQVVGKFLY